MEPYKNKNLLISDRVNDLMSRMTLEEKVAQLCGNLPYNFIFKGKVNKKRLNQFAPYGLGRITQYSLVGLNSSREIAKISNQLQDYFVNETRLGIPVVLQSESLVGYPSEGGTLFPGMMNLAATWREKFAKDMTKIIGQEAHSVGITSSMSPVIDVSRDPRWGRTYETFGEDKYLISQFGINYIRGLQENQVSAIAKHFLGYAETQGGLNTATERLTNKELYDVFATPFAAAIDEADLDGIMASYSEIDGLPVGANPKIARTLLRNKLGFKGMFTSDGAAIWKMFNTFKIAQSYNEAGLIAKKAGLDTEIPVGNAFKHLSDYVREGKLSESYIDESVRRILTIKFKRGLFDNPYVDEDKAEVSMTNPEKQKVSHNISDESIILLKNKNNILPLDKNNKISIIGPHGDSLRYLISGYSYPAYLEMVYSTEFKPTKNVTFNGIADEKAKKKENSGFNAGIKDMFVNPDKIDISKNDRIGNFIRRNGGKTLKEALSQDYTIDYFEGCKIFGDNGENIENAKKVAEKSDVIIAALGGNSGWVDVTGGEGKDRSKLSLPGHQDELLRALESTGKKIILVLFGPGIFSLPKHEDKVDAVIDAWLPGPFGGQSIADVISGKLNPSGKLPVSIPRSVGQIPVFYNHNIGSGYEEENQIGENGMAGAIFTGGYVDDSSNPLHEFGFGLSYSKFKINKINVDTDVKLGQKFIASCEITNESKISGFETVQVYYRFLNGHVVLPVKTLIGYKKVFLKAGETAKVTFNVDTKLLGYTNENDNFVIEPGEALVQIGDSSANIFGQKKIKLKGVKQNIENNRVYSTDSEVIK